MSDVIPWGWQRCSLNDLAVYENGFAFNDRHWSAFGLPIVRIAQITGSQEIVDRYPGRLPDSFRIDSGDLIFSWSGTLAVVRWTGGPAWLNQHLFKVVPGDGVDQSLLFHILQSSVAEMDKRTHGSTMKHIKRGELREFFVILPVDRDEQHKLAQVLDTLDSAILETEAIISKLKAVKKGLLHDLLTRGVAANGELRPSQPEAPHLYKESPLGWIPKEWDSRMLGQACSLIRDGTHLPPVRVADGPLLLSVRNLQGGQFIVTEQDTRVSETFYNQMHKNWEVLKGDVLLAIVGATIGKTAIVGDMPKFTLQRSVAVLRGNPDKLLNPFLHLYMISPQFQLLLWAQVNQTAQPGIYLDQLGRIVMPVPSTTEQTAIQEMVQSVQIRIDREVETALKLRKQKSGLMDDLLTGRVRVKPLLVEDAEQLRSK